MLPSLFSDNLLMPGSYPYYEANQFKSPKKCKETPKAIACQKTQEPEEFTDNRIYVSNIPFSFVEDDLAALFSRFGVVVDVQIVKNERGSKGFGFVTLDNMMGCFRARAELHGTAIQGRIIEVRRATPARRIVRHNSQFCLAQCHSPAQCHAQHATPEQMLSQYLHSKNAGCCNHSNGQPSLPCMNLPNVNISPSNAVPLGANDFSRLSAFMAYAPPFQPAYSSFLSSSGFGGPSRWTFGQSLLPPRVPQPRMNERLTTDLSLSFGKHAPHAHRMQDQLVSMLALDSSLHETVKEGHYGAIGSKCSSPPGSIVPDLLQEHPDNASDSSRQSNASIDMVVPNLPPFK